MGGSAGCEAGEAGDRTMGIPTGNHPPGMVLMGGTAGGNQRSQHNRLMAGCHHGCNP